MKEKVVCRRCSRKRPTEIGRTRKKKLAEVEIGRSRPLSTVVLYRPSALRCGWATPERSRSCFASLRRRDLDLSLPPNLSLRLPKISVIRRGPDDAVPRATGHKCRDFWIRFVDLRLTTVLSLPQLRSATCPRQNTQVPGIRESVHSLPEPSCILVQNCWRCDVAHDGCSSEHAPTCFPSCEAATLLCGPRNVR